MSAITAKASRKMKKYAVLTREPRCFLGSFDFSWEQRKVGDLLIERNQQAPMSDEYPLMAFIANEGVAPKGERYDRSALVTDTVNKLYKKTEKGDFIYSSNNLETGSIGLNKYGKACISPVYSIFEPTGIADSDFLGRRLVRKDFINAMVKWRQGVIYGQWRIHESDFLKIEIPVPSVEEQRKIGAYLDQLDNLITLHQRKCALLFSPFQALISMMFTTSTFSWEQRKLDEIVSFFNGLTYSPKDIRSTGTLVLRSSNVKDGEVVDADNVYVDPAVVDSENVRDGDIIVVVRNGSRALIGKHAEIKGSKPHTVIGAFMTGIRSEHPSFLNALLNTPHFDKEVEMNMGATINQITGYMFSKMEFMLPSPAEQDAIGEYFKQLDNLITLHQRKYISFTGRAGRLISTVNKKRITSSWEQRKFSDITFPAGEKNRDNLPLESYSITNEHGFVPQDEKFENGGTMREADKRMYYIVSPNSFAYNPARINVGSIGYQNIGKNVIVSSLYEVFKTSEDVDDRLLWHWFKSPDFQELIMQLQEGGVRLYFYYDKLCMGEVSLPSLEEQRKIGKLFDTLDNLITLHQRKPFLMKWRNSDANRNQTNRLVL